MRRGGERRRDGKEKERWEREGEMGKGRRDGKEKERWERVGLGVGRKGVFEVGVKAGFNWVKSLLFVLQA